MLGFGVFSFIDAILDAIRETIAKMSLFVSAVDASIVLLIMTLPDELIKNGENPLDDNDKLRLRRLNKFCKNPI